MKISPRGGGLRPRDLQLFLKRLRQRVKRDPGAFHGDGSGRVRYLACGEYGEQLGRPHMHAVLFNCGFKDRQKVGQRGKQVLFESPIVRQLWPHGGHRFGDFDPSAASYIAQYTLKKQGQPNVDLNGDPRPPPFLRMSQKPILGNAWLQKYHNDLRQGYLVQRDGRTTKIPRAYLKQLQKQKPDLEQEIQINKETHRQRTKTDKQQPERLTAAEKIHTRRKQLTEKRAL